MNVSETYEYKVTSLPSIKKVGAGNLERMESHLHDTLISSTPEVREQQEERIALTKYFNDGIAGEEFLPKIVEDFLLTLREKVKAVFDIDFVIDNENIDLGSSKRMECKTQEEMDAYYDELCKVAIKRGGRVLKYPTTTIKGNLLSRYLTYDKGRVEGIDEEKYVALQCHSPNAKGRKKLGFNTLIRPFSHADYKSPELSKDLHIFTSPVEDSLFITKGEKGPNQKIVKQLNYAYIDYIVDDVFEKAKECGKKTIYIPSKNTISKFDEEFVNYLTKKLKEKIAEELKKEKAKSQGISFEEVRFKEEEVIEKKRREELKKEKAKSQDIPIEEVILTQEDIIEEMVNSEWKIEDPLFDSFLPTLINGQYSGEIVICPPDQSEMLNWYRDLNQEEIPEDVDSSKIKDVKVFRIATGSGYGETFSSDDERFEETYTLNEKDVAVSARRALDEAKRKGETLTLVTGSSKSNLVDEKLQQMVADCIGKENFKTKSISDVIKDKLTNPENNDTVFLTANNVGDYLTDFFPQFFYGKLGKAALGVGYEIALAEDDEKNVIARQYAPSTGTAPDITDASQINPAGALLGVAASIENDDKAPQVLKDTLKTVQSNIFKVLKQTSNGNYKGFVENIFAGIGSANDECFQESLAEVG